MRPAFNPATPTWKVFLMFLVPMMLANVLQSLSGALNNIFLGRMIGVSALAAASAFFPIMLFLMSFVMGLGSGASVLAGHWHPAVTLRGPARDVERLPCFCHVAGQGDDVLVLPAFGAFTGSSPQAPPAGSTCWPVGGDRVWAGIRIE